jgi:excisionase family DNA binding protein
MSSVPSPNPEPLWTVREAAAFLRLGRNTVYEWTVCGKLPSLRLGSRVRFEPAALRRWVEVQRALQPQPVAPDPRRF